MEHSNVRWNCLPTVHIRGFTLVEVLVAVSVFSVGLLGLAGLQSYALRTNHSAYLRTQATILSYDIVDRMRANRDQAKIGGYDIALGTAAPSSTDCATPTANCTPAQISQFDLAYWVNSLNAFLPSGDASIARTGNVVTVTVRWDDSQGRTAPQTFTTNTEL